MSVHTPVMRGTSAPAGGGFLFSPPSDLGSTSDWLKQIFKQSRQKHYPDLRSDVSSVWSFCARFSDVISRGNRCWRREMSAVFSGEADFSTRGNATLDARILTERLYVRAIEIYLQRC